jgi:hypothetical protein
MTDPLAPGSRISRDPTLFVYRGAGARATCIASEAQKCRVNVSTMAVLEMKSCRKVIRSNRFFLYRYIFIILHNAQENMENFISHGFRGVPPRLTSHERSNITIHCVF